MYSNNNKKSLTSATQPGEGLFTAHVQSFTVPILTFSAAVLRLA